MLGRDDGYQSRFFKKINKEIEEIEYKKFISIQDNKIIVKPELVKLLRLSAPEAVTNETLSMELKEFVEVTQQKWLRKQDANRWTLPDYKDDNPQLKNSLDSLNLFSCKMLRKPQYDSVVMLGASIPAVAKRFFYLVELIKRKKFNKVFLMGSTAEFSIDYKSDLESIFKTYRDKFKENAVLPDEFSEHEVGDFFMKNLKGLDSFRDADIIRLPSVIKVKEDGNLIYPNTLTEINRLKKYYTDNNITNTSIAVVSHAPFCYRQHLIALELSNQQHVETTAPDDDAYPKLNELKTAGVSLTTAIDELARLFYQLNELAKKNPNLLNALVKNQAIETTSKNAMTFTGM